MSHRVVPTLLDRLFDDAPHQRVEAQPRRLCSLDDYKLSVVRDLEIMVNTRRELLAEALDNYPLLQGTVLEYGLPDFIGKGAHSAEDRQLIQRQLELAIERGDHRFRNVRVILAEHTEQSRMLRFRVEALLILVDVTRSISFDAVLQVNTQEYRVQNLS